MSTKNIWARQLHALGFTATESELDVHAYCAHPCRDIPWRQHAASRWLDKLCANNRVYGVYEQAELESECAAIRESFPQAFSLAREPMPYVLRLGRHIFIGLCLQSGAIGQALLKAMHALVQAMRTMGIRRRHMKR